MNNFLLKPGHSVSACLLRHCSISERGDSASLLPGGCGSLGSPLSICWQARRRVSSSLLGEDMGVPVPYSTFSESTPMGRGRGDFSASEGTSRCSPLGISGFFCGIWLEWSGYYLTATFSSTKSGVCESKSKLKELTTMSLLCCQRLQPVCLLLFTFPSLIMFIYSAPGF